MSVCGAVLLVTSIAALLVGLLIKTSKSTTTTTIPKCLVLLTSIHEVIYGLWNTTAGGSSTLSSPGSGTGNYNPNETPQNIFDQNRTTKYTNYGPCNGTSGSFSQCGTNTGFYLTLQRGTSLLTTIRFLTAPSLPERDPMHITVEGSNQPSSALLLGSSWTLIYNGSSGLDADPGRSSFGVTLVIANNIVWYNSYRFLVTSIRNMSNGVQYSEVEMIGY